jgi:hypothetical protein
VKILLPAVCAIVLFGGSTASYAHRLDEYLQSTLISIEKDRVVGQMHLTPGVAVFSAVLAMIDTDRDGVISESEQRDYAAWVLRDVSLKVDGELTPVRFVRASFPAMEEMKQGRGEIYVEFVAHLLRGGRNRKLVFADHHASGISAYLVNCLVPRDREIRIADQKRNFPQTIYQLDYVVQSSAEPGGWTLWWSPSPIWIGTVVLLLATPFALLWWAGKRHRYGQ